MAVPVAAFGVVFVGSSYPVSHEQFARVDATHWVLDVGVTVNPNYTELKEVALFLLQPGSSVPEGAGLGLYISVGGAEWQYRGQVSAKHPSEVMPLQWPEPKPSQVIGPGVVQLGISMEPQGELEQKEGVQVASRAEFAKRVALDLFRFMESFNVSAAGDQLVVPANIIERWHDKFVSRLQRDKDFLANAGL
eukprot:jgi/Astpho2/1593/e_gw1.00028.60.1_t